MCHYTQIIFIHLLSIITRTDDNEEKRSTLYLKLVNNLRYIKNSSKYNVDIQEFI